jgi:hypothetical protein
VAAPNAFGAAGTEVDASATVLPLCDLRAIGDEIAVIVARLAACHSPRNEYAWAVSTVEEIEKAIERLDIAQQLKLLQGLFARLKISPDDVAWLKLAESAFQFWDNPDDAAYDQL